MKIEESSVKKLTLTHLKGLDPISVFLEDFGEGQGRLTVECFGSAWSHCWGAMGCPLEEFISQCDNDYIATKLFYGRNHKTHEVDTSNLPKNIDYEDLDLIKSGLWPSEEAMEILENELGEDWYDCLPSVRTREYEYLCKIVHVVREAVRSNND